MCCQGDISKRAGNTLRTKSPTLQFWAMSAVALWENWFVLPNHISKPSHTPASTKEALKTKGAHDQDPPSSFSSYPHPASLCHLWKSFQTTQLNRISISPSSFAQAENSTPTFTRRNHRKQVTCTAIWSATNLEISWGQSQQWSHCLKSLSNS